MLVNTDYLVVGGGATGLAFADALLAEADVEVTVIDRRPAPGGHWVDAYPFVRLHTPSAYYGVNSLALGEDRVDRVGENAGYYERATGEEVLGYFAEVAGRLEQSGRARVLTCHEHLGTGSSGEQVGTRAPESSTMWLVRRKVVDARYLEASIPATHATPFQVAPDVRLVRVNDLPAAARSCCSYAVLGSGKTAADACTWLLDNDVQPDRIRWVRPRDAWFYDRAHFQPLAQVGAIMEGGALDAEAGAEAAGLEDLFERLEASGRLTRIDPTWPATMYRGTMLSAESWRACGRSKTSSGSAECDGSRPIGSCSSAERPRPNPTPCTWTARRSASTTPPPRRSSSPIGSCSNRCDTSRRVSTRPSSGSSRRTGTTTWKRTDFAQPMHTPAASRTGPRMVSRTWRTERRWLSEPELSAWMAESRLNLLRALPDHASEPRVQGAIKRYLTHVAAALERLKQLDESSSPRREENGGGRSA